MENRKKPEEEKQYDSMFYWKYDDGSCASLLCNTETNTSAGLCQYSSESKLRWAINKNQAAGAEPEKWNSFPELTGAHISQM